MKEGKEEKKMQIPTSVEEFRALYESLESANDHAGKFFSAIGEKLPEGKTIGEFFTETEIDELASRSGFTREDRALLEWEKQHHEEIEAAQGRVLGGLVRSGKISLDEIKNNFG